MEKVPEASLLIVEDEAVIAWDMAEFLKSGGYRISGIAHDAKTAIRIAECHRPDLALVDVKLAEGDSGLEVATMLRDRLHIPSILVTGHLNDAHAVQECAFGYIQKPFLREEILETIEAGLRWVRQGQVQDPPHGLIPTRKPVRRSWLGAPLRVLVIDDSMSYSRFVETCLREAGYQVETALSGRHAVALCTGPGSFDAAVLDIFMPDQDGLETLRALRQRDPEIWVIAMASPIEGGPLDVLRYARVFGANATLDKPFPCTLLLETLACVAP